jgi:hypothetical protein
LPLAVVASLGAIAHAPAQTPSAPVQVPVVDAAVETVVSGGTWSAGETHGRYRILVVMEGWEEVRHRAYVQWVQESESPHTAEIVRASLDLTSVAKMFGLAEPTVVARAGRWYVIVRGADRRMAEYSRRLTFELGPPGRVRRITAQ